MKQGAQELPEVVLQNAATYPEVRAAPLRSWLAELVREVAPRSTSLGVRFCGDRAMREANRRFRGRDAVTDVLSFADGPTAQAGHLGDLLICVPQARRQARAHGHQTSDEVRVLLLHGLLHCAGYDHESDRGEMEKLERKLRRRWLSER